MAKIKKSEKRLLIALGIVAVISGIILYNIYGPQPAPEVISQTEPSIETTSNTRSPSRSSRNAGGGSRRGRGGSANAVDITNIEKHNKPNDCWVTINGEAYDITLFVQEYQSTDTNISNFCGTYGFEVGFLEKNPILREFVLQNSTKV